MAAAATDEAASTQAEDEGQERRRGFAEAGNCFVCGAELGKRKLNPRHHCRICGNSVCSTCSPSTVKLEGEKALQRACTPCVAVAEQAITYKDRLTNVTRQLHAIGGAGPVEEQPQNLDAAIVACEGALSSLEDQRDSHEALKTRLQGMGQQNEELQRQVQATGADLASTREQLEQAHQSKSALEAEAQRQQQEAHEQAEELQRRVQTSEADLVATREQLEKAHQSKSALEAEAQRQQQEARGQAEAAAEKLRTVEATAAASEARLRDSQQELEREQESTSTLRACEAGLRQELSEAQAQLRDSQQDLEQEQQTASTLRASEADMRKELSEAQAGLRDSKQELEQEQQVTNTLRASEADLRRELSEAQATVRKLETAEGEAVATEARLRDSQEELEREQQAASALRGGEAGLRKQLSEAQAAIEKLRSVEATSANTEARLRNSQQELDKERQAVSTLRASEASLRSELSQAQARQSALQSSMEATTRDLQERLDSARAASGAPPEDSSKAEELLHRGICAPTSTTSAGTSNDVYGTSTGATSSRMQVATREAQGPRQTCVQRGCSMM